MKHLFSDMHRNAARQRRRPQLLYLLAVALAIVMTSPICAPEISARTIEATDTVTAASAFLNYPQQQLDLLTKSMRLDMLDYMQQRDSVYKKANIYMGLSWIEEMRPDYIKVHLSDVSSLQIKVFDKGYRGAPLVMSVYTIDDGDGTADSTLSFFDAEMRQLPSRKFIKTPSPTDFYNIPKDAPVSVKDMEEALPFYTIALTADADSGNLSGELTAANGLTLEERRRLAPYLHTRLQWLWDGRKFSAPRPASLP